MSSERIRELERQIVELKSRWPAHSVPPTMLVALADRSWRSWKRNWRRS